MMKSPVKPSRLQSNGVDNSDKSAPVPSSTPRRIVQGLLASQGWGGLRIITDSMSLRSTSANVPDEQLADRPDWRTKLQCSREAQNAVQHIMHNNHLGPQSALESTAPQEVSGLASPGLATGPV